MIDRKWILAALAASVVAAGAFASGGSDDESEWPGDGAGGRKSGYGRMHDQDFDPDTAFEERRAEMLEDAEQWEGTFTMVDGGYPALVDADGETWYLMIPGMMGRGAAPDEDLIPEEGAEITVTALSGRMSPVHLMVLEAEVDGEALELPEPGYRAAGGRGSRGRRR